MLANLLYLSLLLAAAPLILYRMLRHGRYRRGWGEKLLGTVPRRARHAGPGRPSRLWFHAVSVGEVNLLKDFVTRLKERHPGIDVIVSSSTDTGYDLARRHFGDDGVIFAPLDFSWAVRRALRRVDADQLVLVELEVWPNWVRAAANSGIPVVMINGRLSERSHRGYRRVRRLLAPTFRRLALVACQDTATRKRFLDLGVAPERAQVTGSLKYDGAPQSRDTVEIDDCCLAAGIEPWHRVWLAGSTQAGEEEMALRVYSQLAERFPELRLILVPRHRERFDEVAELIRQHGFGCRRRSRASDAIGPGNTAPRIPLDHRRGETSADELWQSNIIYLVDTIGELNHWWGTAQIALVGGSFGRRGGQNMLEPAGYGAAVAFGPSTRNFRDIVGELKAADAAVEVSDEQELLRFVAQCLEDPPWANALGRAAQQAVAAHRGATQRTLDALQPVLCVSARPNSRAA